MTTIQDLPLDTWVIVMLNVHRDDMLNSFNKLISCQAIKIPLYERLNVFWVVMSQARMYDKTQELGDMFVNAHDAGMFKNIRDRLHEMGFSSEATIDAVRYSNGNLENAFDYLGIGTHNDTIVPHIHFIHQP
tara:strand:- start:881 stop:1276 length:396 start_codon:yes stop_codon:yes gene_type:complete